MPRIPPDRPHPFGLEVLTTFILQQDNRFPAIREQVSARDRPGKGLATTRRIFPIGINCRQQPDHLTPLQTSGALIPGNNENAKHDHHDRNRANAPHQPQERRSTGLN